MDTSSSEGCLNTRHFKFHQNTKADVESASGSSASKQAVISELLEASKLVPKGEVEREMTTTTSKEARYHGNGVWVLDYGDLTRAAYCKLQCAGTGP